MQNDVYSIDDILPIFMVHNISSQQLQEHEIIGDIDFDLNVFPTWTKEDIITGNEGEIIAQLYLTKLYDKKADRVSLRSSHTGYDIVIDEMYFEVKTSQSNTFAFEISKNEINMAKKTKNKYNLFLIHIINQHAYGFIINNPYYTLSLDNLWVDYNKSTCIEEFIPTSFRVKLSKNFSKNLKLIDLDREYKIMDTQTKVVQICRTKINR